MKNNENLKINEFSDKDLDKVSGGVSASEETLISHNQECEMATCSGCGKKIHKDMDSCAIYTSNSISSYYCVECYRAGMERLNKLCEEDLNKVSGGTSAELSDQEASITITCHKCRKKIKMKDGDNALCLKDGKDVTAGFWRPEDFLCRDCFDKLNEEEKNFHVTTQI